MKGRPGGRYPSLRFWWEKGEKGGKKGGKKKARSANWGFTTLVHNNLPLNPTAGHQNKNWKQNTEWCSKLAAFRADKTSRIDLKSWFPTVSKRSSMYLKIKFCEVHRPYVIKLRSDWSFCLFFQFLIEWYVRILISFTTVFVYNFINENHFIE